MQQVKMPKVSVCVITYNHGNWLEECLQSIVTQLTNFPFEVIVGDDCSTDGITRKVLQKFSERYPDLIVALFRDENMGGWGTQNWLDVMRRAQGEYIAHIDGDDRMLPGKLQKQVNFLDANPDCTVVAHELRTFDGSSGVVISKRVNNLSIPKKTDIKYLLLNLCFFGHSSKMFRRSALITARRDNVTVDYYMHIEHATKGFIGYIHEVLGEYRKSPSSHTGSVSSLSEIIIGCYQDAFSRAIELGVDRNLVYKAKLRFNYSVARSALVSGNRAKYIKYIYLQDADVEYASFRHNIYNKLRFSPAFTLVLIRFGSAIRNAITFIKYNIRTL